MSTLRTIRTVKVVIETPEGIGHAEHDKRVGWVDSNVSDANKFLKGAFVSTVVLDDRGKVVRFSGTGEGMTPETEEIIHDLMDEPAEAPKSA